MRGIIKPIRRVPVEPRDARPRIRRVEEDQVPIFCKRKSLFKTPHYKGALTKAFPQCLESFLHQGNVQSPTSSIRNIKLSPPIHAI